MMKCRSGFTWYAAALAIVALALSAPREAEAKGGTHATAVSTWDTSASSVVAAFQNGFMTPDGGHLRIASYHVNFSSTSGKLSSQFGLQYLNYAETSDTDSSNGIGGTVLAQWAIPMTDRFENGLPKASFNIFFGAAPAALINGQYNFVTIPLVLGIGIPLSPVKYISIVPWVEFAPSLNLDTRVKPFEGALTGYTVDPENPEQVNLSQDDVEKILTDSVEMELSFAAKLRGGLTFVVHMGDRADLQITGAVTRVGTGDSAKTAIFVGGGLAFAWDRPVPAVLPVERRLENESCEAIGARYDVCYGPPKPEETPAPDPTAVETGAQSPEPAQPEPTPPPASAPSPAP